MKTKKINQKLTLNKRTVASLDDSDLNSVKGGGPTDTCGTCDSVCATYSDCSTHCGPCATNSGCACIVARCCG